MGVRLLIAAEHALIVEGFAQLVSTEPDLEVVGRATSNEKLVARCRVGSADVIVVDVALLTADGLEIMQQLRRRCPHTRLLVLSNDDDSSVVRALRAGATGCIPKSASAKDFFDAIRRVAAGQPYFPMELTPALLKQLTEQRLDPLEHLSRSRPANGLKSNTPYRMLPGLFQRSSAQLSKGRSDGLPTASSSSYCWVSAIRGF